MTDSRSYYRDQALANYTRLFPGKNPTILTAKNEAGEPCIFVVAATTGELILEHEGTTVPDYRYVLTVTEDLLSKHIVAIRAGHGVPGSNEVEGLRIESEGWKNEVEGWKNEVAGWKRENEGLKKELEAVKGGHPVAVKTHGVESTAEVERLKQENERLKQENETLKRDSADAASQLWISKQVDGKGKEVAVMSEGSELEWTPVPSEVGDGEMVTYRA